MERGDQARAAPSGTDALWRYAALLVLVGGVFVSARTVTLPYSYWLDELYSVTESRQSWLSLYRLVLTDVHPPLYHALLKVWIALFGDGEMATRSLSWLFAMGAAASIAWFGRRHGHVFLACAVAIFFSNELFAYYANETRPYAMALCLSAVATTHYPFGSGDRPAATFLLSCLFLSLTHYFGLILAAVLLGFCLAENYRSRTSAWRICGTALLCLPWPAWHALRGTILDKSGGHFWIKVNGALDSLGIAASGFLPRDERFGAYVLVAWILFAVSLAASSALVSRDRHDSLAGIGLRTGLMLAAFLAIVAVVDLSSPMSTRRNYIVILPLMTLSFACTVALLVRRFAAAGTPLLLLVFVFGLATLRASYAGVMQKSSAPQNWQGAATVIVQNAAHRALYFTTDSLANQRRELVANYYVGKATGGTLMLTGMVLGKTRVTKPALILTGHNQSDFGLLREEMSQLGAVQVFPVADMSKGYAAGVWLVN